MGSPIVHFEIAGKDYDNLEKFYSRLFGWKIDKADVGGFTYGHIGEGEAGPLKGGIRHEPEDRPIWWCILQLRMLRRQ